MEATRHSIDFQEGSVSYLKYGTGPETILAFHGFGQSAEKLLEYIRPLGSSYTIYSFDHFFHGKSVWNSPKIIRVERFREILTLFFKKEAVDHFHILGYSLGGKWAHSIVRFFPEKVKKVFLCAPDGSKTTFYYNFSARNPIGRFLFRKTVQNPKTFFNLLRGLYKIGWLNKSLYRFVYFQMGSRQKRSQVYNTWIKYRNYKGLSPTTIKVYNKHNIPLMILLGSYDRVIQPKWFDEFRTRIKNLEIKVVKKGHRSILTSIASSAKEFFPQ